MECEDDLEAVWFSKGVVTVAKHTVCDRHLQLSSLATGEQHGLNDGRVVSIPDIVIRRAQGQSCAVGKKQILKARHDVVIVGYVHIHCAVHAKRECIYPVQRSLDVP